MQKYLNPESLRQNLPTVYGFLDRRKKSRKNQLPKHLRPLPLWPLRLQLALNTLLICTHLTLMWNKDEYVTDVGPAIPMTVTMLFLFYVLVSAAKMRSRFSSGRGARWAKINILLTVLSFLSWAGTVAVFLL